IRPASQESAERSLSAAHPATWAAHPAPFGEKRCFFAHKATCIVFGAGILPETVQTLANPWVAARSRRARRPAHPGHLRRQTERRRWSTVAEHPEELLPERYK